MFKYIEPHVFTLNTQYKSLLLLLGPLISFWLELQSSNSGHLFAITTSQGRGINDNNSVVIALDI